jgi:small subunit ribosomal protein S17
MGDGEKRNVAVRGVVTSAAMDKTIVVEVKRQYRHPRFRKYIRRSTSFYAHDEGNKAREGDLVELVQTRPLSKLKRWRLARILTASGGET